MRSTGVAEHPSPLPVLTRHNATRFAAVAFLVALLSCFFRLARTAIGIEASLRFRLLLPLLVVVLLPDAGMLERVEKELDESKVERLIGSMKAAMTEVALPKLLYSTA